MIHINTIAQQVLQQHGILRSATLEERIPAPAQPSFEAFTNRHSNQTTLRYNPRFQLPQGAQTFARKKNIAVPLETCLRAIMGHECGHIHNQKRPACPETFEAHEEHFYEPIAAILKKKKKLGAVDSVTNLAEDLINNTISALGAHGGLTLFYKDVAVTSGWQSDYEAYMRLQLYCWGDAQDKKLLTPHFTKNPEVTKATQQFVRKMEELQGKKSRLTHQEIADYVADKKNWKTIAHEFTLALEPLITEQPSFPQCGFGKQMKEAMKDPTNREKCARKNYETQKKRPSWMSKEEALDAVYSALARDIVIKVDAPHKAMSLPVVPIRHEPFNPEEHAFSSVRFTKPMIVPERETAFGVEALTFGVASQYVEQPLLVKKGITSFPPYKSLYIDCSGTMTLGIPHEADAGSTVFIPWGDKSRYHYACKSWYGIIEYLARQQILPNVVVGLGIFSDSSRVVQGLEEAKKLLFNPAFGSTNIDLAAIDQLLQDEEKSVFSTVSDGEINNWSAIKAGFIQRVKPHYYFHIQIGPHTAMTKDLKKANLPVYTVTTGEELERLSVDLTRQQYQSYIDVVVEHLR